MTMTFFLLRHLLLQLRRLRIALAEIFGEAHINAAVLFFAGNGNRPNLSLRQIGKFRFATRYFTI